MPDMFIGHLALEERVARASARVAPLWPLRDFVAVNPFLGLADQPFAEAAATLRRVAGQDLLPSPAFFAEAIARGRIAPRDMEAAGARPPAPRRAAPGCPTVALLLDDGRGTRWDAFVADEISRHCAAWADEGQASWAMPWRHLGLHAAWRAALRHDRAFEVAGLSGFRAALAELPEATLPAIAGSLAALGVPEARLDDYLHRLLISFGGWAGLLRARAWHGGGDAVADLLAIRLSCEAVLLKLHPDAVPEWQTRLAAPPTPEDLAPELRLLDAYEAGFRRDLAARLAAPAPPRPPASVQAVFCIDVRSEPYRRALEAVSEAVETLGFAGFFGFSIEHVRFGDAKGSAQCPVLLAPSVLICERPEGAAPAEAAALLERRGLRRRLADLWGAFRTAAVSSFAYVETAGLTAAAGLLRGALRRPASEPDHLASLAPEVAPGTWQGRPSGMSSAARLDAAEAVLRAMSLTRDFGGLVLLVGHASRSVNNAHAASLDCGACGGHSGESNARVAAAVLNDPLVRAGLAQRGITIPPDTWFLAALHETTTDAVRLFDADRVPPSQAALLARTHGWLGLATRRCRAERLPLLGPGPGAEARAADWSEVRPEWALANNASFIAAPRARTAGRDLGGRAFLHSYDWRDDAGFGVLELILTAPVVVASWINLQYFGSTVDNAAWGSGNKTLHNVAGLAGVLEGQGGDLRAGLPWQSVHDGTRFMHEPMRLQVMIEAPEDAMDAVLARHPGVRDLVDHAWLHLFSLAEDGSLRRRHAAGDWRDAA